MTDGGFDAVVAARYERDVRERFEPEHLRDVVGVLAELTGHRPALEFAVGTGRIALPLAARGVEVHGIELSNAMITEMMKTLEHVPVKFFSNVQPWSPPSLANHAMATMPIIVAEIDGPTTHSSLRTIASVCSRRYRLISCLHSPSIRLWA